MKLLRRHAIALLALFVALGGTATGTAALIITGENVKDGSLTGADVKNRSLTGEDVRHHTLAADNFKKGQLPRGPQGPKGDTGSANGYTKSESDARYLAAGGTAADANLLDGLDSDIFGRRAASDYINTDLFHVNETNCGTVNDTLPSVTVDVGPARAVAVYMSADFYSHTDGQRTRIEVREHGGPPYCTTVLSTTSSREQTKNTIPGSTTGTTAFPAGFVILPTSGGRVTIYAAIDTGADGATVRGMTLIVLPL